LTSEFTITAANTINNATGTATNNDQLWVFWEDMSTSAIDRTSVAKITSLGNIQLTAATTGSRLLITYGLRGAFGNN